VHARTGACVLISVCLYACVCMYVCAFVGMGVRVCVCEHLTRACNRSQQRITISFSFPAADDSTPRT